MVKHIHTRTCIGEVYSHHFYGVQKKTLNKFPWLSLFIGPASDASRILNRKGLQQMGKGLLVYFIFSHVYHIAIGIQDAAFFFFLKFYSEMGKAGVSLYRAFFQQHTPCHASSW